MSADKNLFPYDLAVVSIMKNAAPYVKEWLDYHLLAGVNHFFIYDNESTDNFKEVLQPYIDAGLITYIFYPGKVKLLEAYNNAINRFKFSCRLMTFVDDDEFILPKENFSIAEVTDKFLSVDEKVAGLEFSWILYGSNNLEKADYSVGVLERFTSRAEKVAPSVKSVINPRRVQYMWTPHFAIYQQGYFALNQSYFKDFQLADEIVMNHYHTKSLEEYALKRARGDVVASNGEKYVDGMFKAHDRNEVFDDGILKYRDGRSKIFLPNGDDIVETFSELNRVDYEKLFTALTANLFVPFEKDNPKEFFSNAKNRYVYFNAMFTFLQNAPDEIFKNELEKYLTCLATSTYLKENFLGDDIGKLFEEYSLCAVEKVLQNEITLADFQLLMQEMPKILALPYPVVNKIRRQFIKKIEQQKNIVKDFIGNDNKKLPLWKLILRLDYQIKILEVFDK